MAESDVPAGWYPDSTNGGAVLRWWDGSRWTENYADDHGLVVSTSVEVPQAARTATVQAPSATAVTFDPAERANTMPRRRDRFPLLAAAVGVLAFGIAFATTLAVAPREALPGSPIFAPAFPLGFACPGAFQGRAGSVLDSAMTPVDSTWFTQRGLAAPPPGGCAYAAEPNAWLGDVAYVIYPGAEHYSRNVFKSWVAGTDLQFAYEDGLAPDIPLLHWVTPDAPAPGSRGVNVALFEDFPSGQMADVLAPLDGTAVTLAIFVAKP